MNPQRLPRRSGALLIVVLLALSACGEQPDGPPATETDQRSGPTEAEPADASQARTDDAGHGCADLPSADQLRQWLIQAPGAHGDAGGLTGGRHEWLAVVDRNGTLCATTTTDEDPTKPWPGSRGIAIAKASTANGFSTDTAPLSTANLYTMSQPGRSLWGANAGDPLNPACLGAPGSDAGIGMVCGGLIAFGGGLPLYRDGLRVGGLGASGDTPCADHEIAKRVRHAAQLDPPGGLRADDITYSSVDGPSLYTHPLCANTWRNAKKVGEAPLPQGY